MGTMTKPASARTHLRAPFTRAAHPAARLTAVCFCAVLVAALCSSARAQLAGTQYQVINIGSQIGQPFSAGFSVSNTGYVAGVHSAPGSGQHAFLWRQDTGVVALNHPSGSGDTLASEVNNAGKVIGVSFSPTRSVLWNPNGLVANIFQSQSIDSPEGINTAGRITGRRNTSSSQSAFLWNNVSYTDIGWPAAAASSQGYDINDLDQIGGTLNGGTKFGNFTTAPAVFLWSQAAGFTTIPTSSTYEAVTPLDLSNTGTIVGSATWNGGANGGGWRWSATAGFSMLSGLPGQTQTQTLAVNDSSIAVGRSGTTGSLSAGVIWDAQGTIYKANDLLAPAFTGWNVTEARGINNLGWITGVAIPPTGGTTGQAVLLIPIPEPATFSTLALAAGALLMRRCLRR